MAKKSSPTFDKIDFDAGTRELVRDIEKSLLARIALAYAALTDDERAKFATRDMAGVPEQFPKRLASTIVRVNYENHKTAFHFVADNFQAVIMPLTRER